MISFEVLIQNEILHKNNTFVQYYVYIILVSVCKKTPIISLCLRQNKLFILKRIEFAKKILKRRMGEIVKRLIYTVPPVRPISVYLKYFCKSRKIGTSSDFIQYSLVTSAFCRFASLKLDVFYIKHIVFLLTLIIFFLTISLGAAKCQVVIPKDSIVKSVDTLNFSDGIKVAIDSLGKDTTKVTVTKKGNRVDAPVEYTATDSMLFNIKEQKVYLYNAAQINYKEIELKADYIEIDFGKDEAFAAGVKDSTGKEVGKPQFKDGGDEFTAHTLRYNFKTKKGIITGVITEQSGGFLHSEKTKRLSNGNVCLKNGLYTTCDLEHPHFYVNLTKAKVIPNEKIISGPAYLVIEDVPIPLGIPFGFFPNKKGNKSGIIIPEYGEEINRGFFLKGGGYYFAISDYVDATIKCEVYSHGSWGSNLYSNYKKRYKYNGNFNLSYTKLIISEKELPNYSNSNQYWLRWMHSQDAKAHPNHTFSANVNFGSSSYNRYNNYSVNNRLQSNVQSNISYVQRWANSPFNFSANIRHSQNLTDSTINLSIPELNLSLSRQTFFKPKGGTGKQRWYKSVYENFGFSYNSNLSNNIQTKETLLFTEQTLHNFNNGIRHSVPVSTSLKVLKYFMLNPSLNYNERWYFKTINKTWQPVQDTIPAYLKTDTVKGFKRAGDYMVSIPFTTKLYGFFQSRNSNAKIIALRHMLTPSVSYSYRPDYSKQKYGYYKTVQKDTAGQTETYSIFSNSMFGGPNSGKYGAISLNLGNNLEMKVRAKKDTITGTKKIVLLESLSFGSSYNMALDSMKWSSINISGRTTLFKMVDINFSGIIDPYAYDSTGRKLKMSRWKQNQKIGRLQSGNLSAGFNLNSDGFKKKDNNQTEVSKQAALNSGLPDNYLNYYVDFKIPWNFRTDLSLYYTTQYNEETYKFKHTITKTLSFSTDVNLTSKWKVSVQSGYDIENRQLTYTNINIYRDLHCWEMRFSWIPFGSYKSYSFQINVKSAVLQDLKLLRRRNWTENF